MISYLLSYFFFGDSDLAHLAASTGRADQKFFADSGAYSAHTTGQPVNVKEYAEWLHQWEAYLDPYANLDVKFDLEAGNANQTYLESCGLHPTPVYHLGEPLDFFRELCEQYDLIAVGNMTGPSRKDARLWNTLDHLHATAEQHDTKLHGFGMTTWPLVQRWPWGSVDSSRMGEAFRFGRVRVWDWYLKDWHEWRAHDEGAWHRHGWLLREMGFDPQEFAGRSRKEQLVPLMVLAGATWARATHDLGGTDVYLADLAFGQAIEGKLRIEWYEQGVQMTEASLV